MYKIILFVLQFKKNRYSKKSLGSGLVVNGNVDVRSSHIVKRGQSLQLY